MWPDNLGPGQDSSYPENRPYWNLGCASQRNLAAMVENPADLVQPRGDTPTYTGRRTTVLDRYHRGESSATVYPDADKGKISDISK
jgi:pilus assembly protein CpaD